MIGGMWLSGIMERFNVSIDEQLRMIDAFTKICHSYYKKFLDVNNDLFLNTHDLDNLCRIWDAVNDRATYHVGIAHIFYFYCRVVSEIGANPLTEELENVLMQQMVNLNLMASKDLAEDNPHFQESHA